VSARVWLPSSPAELTAWYAAGSVPAEIVPVLADSEDEEDEYAALMTAADASLERGDRRRVVVVAEVATPGSAVVLRDWVAVHADTEDRAADADPDDDLAWFATQEIPAVLDQLGAV